MNASDDQFRRIIADYEEARALLRWWSLAVAILTAALILWLLFGGSR